MNIMQNRIYIVVILLLLSKFINVSAQDPMGLYYMKTIPQSSFLNPALQPRAHGYMSLPDVSQNLKLDVAFKNLIQNKDNKWLLPLEYDYDYKKLRLATGKSLDIQEALYVDILGFGFRSGDIYFTFDTKVKTIASFGIPYDLLSFADEGFPNGKTFDLSPLKVSAYSYLETSFGLSKEFGERLSLGVRFKPLVGLVAANTDLKVFDLHTSIDYWEYDLKGNINVAGPVDIEVTGDIDNGYEFDFKLLEGDEIIDYATKSYRNLGVAFDFGADYKITERWSASASLINLGSLKWRNHTNSFELEGNFQFEGVEGEGLDGDFNEKLNDIVEELKKSFSHPQNIDGFATKLAPELYVGTNYQLTSSLDFGLLSRSIFYKNNFRQDFNVSANFQPYSFMSANVNYSLRPRGGNGLGTSLMFLVGPLQIYTIVEYLSPFYSDFYFDDYDKTIMFPEMRNLSVKVGLNLVFNRHGYKDIPMLKGY